MKEYKNDDLIVYWFPELCAHVGACIRLQPEVFDSKRRPWILLDKAKPEDIIKAVNQCPSGALRFNIPEGSKVNPDCAAGPAHMDNMPEPDSVKIKASALGPIFIQGPATVCGSENQVLAEGCRMMLCGCGKTCNKPFCDGSHMLPQ
ncbi:MAG: hypothetical protein GX025_07335 [Clostridiales bacterium]|nr:hypothetical protein [Clostridiales bacterium]